MSAVLRHDLDGIVHLELNRADKRNAIDDAMFEELAEHTAAIREDASIGAVVLSGAGVSFCAGLDFSVHAAFADEGAAGERPYADPDDPTGTGRRTPGRGQRVVSALRDAPAVVVAAIQGHAIGGGLQLALAADIRLVTATARLGLAEIDWGLTADMGATQLLPRLVGPDHAIDLLTTGRLITGDEAVRLGLATRTAADPLAEALELATRIAGRSRPAVHADKRLVHLASSVGVDEGMHEELRVMARNIGSPQQVAAATARLAQRTRA